MMARFKHLLAAALLCGGTTPCAFAQQPSPRRTTPEVKAQPGGDKSVASTPARPVEIENLVADARTVRAEFAADVLIRLAESSLVTDKTWKRELIEEAFRTAAGAHHPFKLESLDGQVDTRPGYLTRAMAMFMDALSLRQSAVRAMMGVDKRRARELFAEIPPRLPLPRVECEDAMVAEVSEFYDMLTRVARESFTPEEKARDEDVRFVEAYAGNITSPAQVQPMASTIAAVGDTPARLETLTRAFGKALRNMSGDDRTFTAWLDNSVGGVRLLSARSKERGVETDNLLASARDYFARHLTAARCTDSVRRAARSAELFKSLDEILSEPAPEPRDPRPASFAELRPASVGGGMQVFRHWRTPAGARLLLKVKELRFGPGAVGEALSAADRKTPQWEARLLEFRDELADWDERGEATAEDYFHQKCVLYWALLELLPPGAAQDQVLADYVAFLRQPTIQQDSPLEWFVHVKDLLDLSRRAAPEMPPRRAELLAALRDSGDPVIRLYADLERLLAREAMQTQPQTTPPRPAPTPKPEPR
jgi:hypothetical protein